METLLPFFNNSNTSPETDIRNQGSAGVEDMAGTQNLEVPFHSASLSRHPESGKPADQVTLTCNLAGWVTGELAGCLAVCLGDW